MHGTGVPKALIEEDGHVFGVAVDLKAVVECRDERNEDRRAPGLRQLAGPEGTRNFCLCHLREQSAWVAPLAEQLHLMESIAALIDCSLSVDAARSIATV